jgi:pectate lyase
VSNVYFHDHFKGSLVGHSDSNCPEDSGHLLVTFAYNYWNTIYSRGPMVRCGQVHVFNSYYYNLGDAIRTRAGAQMLVENSVFELTNDCIITKDGYAVARGNDYGQGTNEAPAGTFTTAPYTYNLLETSSVKAYCQSNSGVILSGI